MIGNTLQPQTDYAWNYLASRGVRALCGLWLGDWRGNKRVVAKRSRFVFRTAHTRVNSGVCLYICIYIYNDIYLPRRVRIFKYVRGILAITLLFIF